MTELAAGFVSMAVAVFAADMPTIPRSLSDQLKLELLDTLGHCAAASRGAAGEQVMGVMRERSGSEEATVLGTSLRLPARDAAMASGALAHLGGNGGARPAAGPRPSVVVLPAVMATAERVGADGHRTLRGLAAGYELHTRLVVAAGAGMASRAIDPNTVCGAVAAAAGAATTMELSADEITSAMGVAISMASGLLYESPPGSAASGLAVGWAAAGGVLAAELASRGFRGCHAAIEGRKALLRAFSDEDSSADDVIADLGVRWLSDATTSLGGSRPGDDDDESAGAPGAGVDRVTAATAKLVERYYDNVRGVVTEQQAQQVVDQVLTLEAQADVGGIVALHRDAASR
jgi:2-methylcitrate dehydratase PrpD